MARSNARGRAEAPASYAGTPGDGEHPLVTEAWAVLSTHRPLDFEGPLQSLYLDEAGARKLGFELTNLAADPSLPEGVIGLVMLIATLHRRGAAQTAAQLMNVLGAHHGQLSEVRWGAVSGTGERSRNAAERLSGESRGRRAPNPVRPVPAGALKVWDFVDPGRERRRF